MERRNKPHAVILTVMILFAIAIFGCAPDTRYKVLTIFFTGVPSPEEIERQRQQRLEKERLAAIAAQEKQEERLSEESEQPSSKVNPLKGDTENRPQLYSHTPYAQGNCDGCHKSAINLRMVRRNTSQKVFSKGGGRPGVLLAPRQQLCLKCHPEFSKQAANAKNLWLHTPAAYGDCDTCHDPHQSRTPGVLVEPPPTLCLTCHPVERLSTSENHNQRSLCLECHNPHFGKNNTMLVDDYVENGKP